MAPLGPEGANVAWLVGIVVLILLVVSAGFRSFVVGLIAIAMAIGGAVYLYNEHEEKQALSRIPLSKLAFEDVSLKTEYGSHKMTGRLKNMSARYTLTNVTFVVTMRDCVDAASSKNCIIIGESDEAMYVSIPPGQARDFDEYIYFPRTLKAKNQLQWDYRVTGTKGK
jgi:hypothetical protein